MYSEAFLLIRRHKLEVLLQRNISSRNKKSESGKLIKNVSFLYLTKKLRDYVILAFFISSTFVYEPILIKISMDINNI